MADLTGVKVGDRLWKKYLAELYRGETRSFEKYCEDERRHEREAFEIFRPMFNVPQSRRELLGLFTAELDTSKPDEEVKDENA